MEKNHKKRRQKLHDLCQYVAPIGKMVEIGSLKGVSTIIFAQYAEEVISVDPYIGNYDSTDGNSDPKRLSAAEKKFLENTKDFPNIRQIKKLSVEAAPLFKNGSLDLVYVDGCHTFKCVCNDIKIWLPKATKFFAGHDWPRRSVQNAVRKVLGEPHKIFGDGSWLFKL
jgi:hypothetical protein